MKTTVDTAMFEDAWIQTLTGHPFWPASPDPETISLRKLPHPTGDVTFEWRMRSISFSAKLRQDKEGLAAVIYAQEQNYKRELSDVFNRIRLDLGLEQK